jgi:hypothetical protein
MYQWFESDLLQVRESVTSPAIQARANSTFQSSAGLCMSFLTISSLNLTLMFDNPQLYQRLRPRPIRAVHLLMTLSSTLFVDST